MKHKKLETRYYNKHLVVCPPSKGMLVVCTEILVDYVDVWGVSIPIYTHRYSAWDLSTPRRRRSFRRKRELVSWMKQQADVAA